MTSPQSTDTIRKADSREWEPPALKVEGDAVPLTLAAGASGDDGIVGNS
jgi:hypothetical protein